MSYFTQETSSGPSERTLESIRQFARTYRKETVAVAVCALAVGFA